MDSYKNARRRKRKVRVEDLVLGMYVAEPDGVWTPIGTVTTKRVAKRRRQPKSPPQEPSQMIDRLSRATEAGNYTKPGMRRRLFNDIKAAATHGTKAGNSQEDGEIPVNRLRGQ